MTHQETIAGVTAAIASLAFKAKDDFAQLHVIAGLGETNRVLGFYQVACATAAQISTLAQAIVVIRDIGE